MEPKKPPGRTTFSDGFDSGRTGEPRTTNPHMADSIREMHWFAGWDEGSAKRNVVNAKPDTDNELAR